MPDKLEYLGKGNLPTRVNNKVEVKGLAENDCVLHSTLFDDVSMVLSCPGDTEGPICQIVYSLDKPVLDVASSDSDKHSCRAYKFNSFDSVVHSKSIIEEMERDERKLDGKKWQVYDDNIKVFDGAIVAHEITRHNDVHRIDESMLMPEDVSSTLNDVFFVDCNKACQLDLACRAYSFCKDTKVCSLTSKDVVYGPWLFVKKEQQQDASNNETSANYNVPENSAGTNNKPYKLLEAKFCTIYEKNHLDMYSKTDDFIYVDKSIVANYHEMDLDVCARATNILEHGDSSEYHPTFAYCGHPRVCLADLTKIRGSDKTENSANINDGTFDGDQQMFDNYERCRIYNKRYQSYFQMSSQILVESANVKQVKILDKSLEECAHLCWQHDTHRDSDSFDHCVTKSDDGKSSSMCVINTVTNDDVKLETTTKWGCFHYEKDHSLHQLRRRISSSDSPPVGDQTVTDERTVKSGSSLTMGSYLLMLLLLITGVLIGDKVNPKLSEIAKSVYNGSTAGLRSKSKRTTMNGRTVEEVNSGVAMNVINRKLNDRSLLKDEL